MELPTWKRFLDRDFLLQHAAKEGGIFGGRAWQIRAWLVADQPGDERLAEEILKQAGITASHAVYGPILEHAARTTEESQRKGIL